MEAPSGTDSRKVFALLLDPRHESRADLVAEALRWMM